MCGWREWIQKKTSQKKTMLRQWQISNHSAAPGDQNSENEIIKPMAANKFKSVFYHQLISFTLFSFLIHSNATFYISFLTKTAFSACLLFWSSPTPSPPTASAFAILLIAIVINKVCVTSLFFFIFLFGVLVCFCVKWRFCSVFVITI